MQLVGLQLPVSFVAKHTICFAAKWPRGWDAVADEGFCGLSESSTVVSFVVQACCGSTSELLCWLVARVIAWVTARVIAA